ncbi:hypothetical protein [Streptomyces sp. NPDC051218]|uniref:hypothetical protein n=1 Tax=Streptomyces sp. NPDC051218 TaxID=3365645 RepID=UPI0037AAB3F8
MFWSRDPEGMQACLDGAEVPPWDVVEALLHDLATAYGAQAAERETRRARALHAASLAAYDARPGGHGLLGERLDMMLTEQRFAVERQAELGRSLAVAASQVEVEQLNRDLAWVRDDLERATARCAELRERIEGLDRAGRPQWVDFGAPVSDDFAAVEADDFAERDLDLDSNPEPAQGAGAPRVPRQGRKSRDPSRRTRRPRGARFAGFTGVDDGEGAEGPGPVTVPATAVQSPAANSPRGARFGPAAEEPGAPVVRDIAEPDRDDAGRATADAVAELIKLRGEGRSGEAHGVLVEAAGWPASRLPVFAGELHRAGLGADWSTLLWEAASLPPDRLVALADALAGAGRAEDCRKLLRQGVSRPAPEIAEAVLALIDAGREREARALLDAYIRVRTPEDTAGCAHTDPYRLIPLLLQAAQGVSDESHWDLVHALRVAGFST